MHDGVGVSFSGTYGLPSACARVTILCTQVVGHPHWRSARAPVHDPGLVGHAPLLRCIRHHPLVHLGLGLCLSLLCDHYGCSLFCLFVLSACACSSEVRGALCGRSVRDCGVTASAAVRHIVGGNPRTHTHTHTHTSHSGVNAPSASRAFVGNMGQLLRNRQP